jgi:hypothetical protein
MSKFGNESISSPVPIAVSIHSRRVGASSRAREVMRNHRADGTTAAEETTCCISREFIKNIFEKLSSG